jgi:hypothetical protein
MKIPITGLPAENTPVIQALTDADRLDLIEVSDPYLNRGTSCLVRIHIQARLHADGRTAP